MSRESFIKSIPEEWKQNMKAGLCPVCGKPPTQFAKGRKTYCSEKCANLFRSKIIYWNELRERIVETHTSCEKCGKNQKSLDREAEKAKKELIKKIKVERQKEIIKYRMDRLVILDRQYEQLMDDDYVAENVMDWKEEPRAKYIQLEVDHIIPLALGGDMWDEKNLQVLCTDCHKKKTKEDKQKIAKLKVKET